MTPRFKAEHDGARAYYVIDTQTHDVVAGFPYHRELDRSTALNQAKAKMRELNARAAIAKAEGVS